MEKRSFNPMELAQKVKDAIISRGLAGYGHAREFAGGVGQGVGRVGENLIDHGARSAFNGMVGQGQMGVSDLIESILTRTPTGSMATPFDAGVTVGRTAPLTVPGGMAIKGVVDKMREKDAEYDRDAVLLLEGFVEKCAELGQDPELMWKAAGLPSISNIGNYFGSNPSSVTLTPEGSGIGGSIKDVFRRVGGAYRRVWGGADSAQAYNDMLQAQNREYQLSKNVTRDAVKARGQAGSLEYNPYTQRVEPSAAHRERMYAKSMTPYWEARNQTRRARYGASGIGYPGSTVGSATGTAYTPGSMA